MPVVERVRTVEIGLFPATAAMEEILGPLAGGGGAAELVRVRSVNEVGFIRTPRPPGDLVPLAPAVERELLARGSWTRYEVRAGTQRTPLRGLSALVLSEEDAFRPGVVDGDYERWVDGSWGPGVTSLPGYGAAFLLRGLRGTRGGRYASIGWFSDGAARERLLLALGERFPPELAPYRRLIDVAFATYLDPAHRRFLRLDAVPGSDAARR